MTENRAIELLEYIRKTGNGEAPYVGCAQEIAIDMSIQAIEKIQQYRAMEEKLNGISVKEVVNGFISTVEKETCEGYERGRILTNEDAEKWNAYRAIGTVEELVNTQIREKVLNVELESYKEIGTIEEFKDLKVKNSELHNEVQAINATMSLFEQEIRNKAIDEFAEKLKYELNGNIIPDKEKFTYAVKQQEQICHQNTTLKRAIKYVEYIAGQMKGGE